MIYEYYSRFFLLKGVRGVEELADVTIERRARDGLPAAHAGTFAHEFATSSRSSQPFEPSQDSRLQASNLLLLVIMDAEIRISSRHM